MRELQKASHVNATWVADVIRQVHSQLTLGNGFGVRAYRAGVVPQVNPDIGRLDLCRNLTVAVGRPHSNRRCRAPAASMRATGTRKGGDDT
jgi:hypothetical protein